MSGDGGKVVVCLTDLSCSVFNTTDLASGLLMRTNNNTIASLQFGVALFTAGDTFYVGSISGQGRGATIILEQQGEGFVRSSSSNSEQNDYEVSSTNVFSRHFFSGSEKHGNAYLFVVDVSDLVDVGRFRVMRVCHVPMGPTLVDSQHCMKQTLSVMDLYEPTPVFVVCQSVIILTDCRVL